jgi:FkbH-like protein
VQAQVQRENQRNQMSRDDFLKEAAPSVTMNVIRDSERPRYDRIFELVNKTNQFNTTGRRWTPEDFRGLLASGAAIHTFEVVDKYTDYGLVGVVIVVGDTIEQWVMSCRVLGYQIEEAVMASVVKHVRASGYALVKGSLTETDVNFPCRTLFSKCGFTLGQNGYWILEADQGIDPPAHVTVQGLGNEDVLERALARCS